MRDEATVTEIKGSTVTVKLEKKDECDKCGMCLFPKNAKHVYLKADNKLGAKEGDVVMVESSSNAALIGAILVFLVPLVFIGIATLINYLFIKKEIWILIISVILIVLWYTVLAGIDKKLSRKSGFKPKIIEIIKEDKENG